jgi:heavy metal translocating P-type ATPase
MFFHICVLTAAVHFGRKLYRQWQEQESSSVTSGAVPPPGVPGADAVDSDEAAVDEQFKLALVSTGLTGVATLVAPPLRVLGGASVMYGSLPIMARAKMLLVGERRIGAEVLDTLGLVTMLATGHILSSSFIFLMYAGSRKLQQRTQREAQDSVIDAFGRRSELVWLWKDGAEVSVALESLSKGDVVVVDAGSPIPVDGVVTQGHGVVDQHFLTGESQPLEKATGDRVFASTVVVSGRLFVEVLTTGTATVAAEISETLRRTADATSSLEAQGQAIAHRMAPPTLALSAIALPFVGPNGSIALLNSSFLDNMRFFNPFSMLQYLREAYDVGILVKDGRSLQVLPKVDTVIFDKTGTLTRGQLRISAIYPAGEAGEDDVVMCAAAAEHHQTHPIALAIFEEAKRREQIIAPIDETAYEIGRGLTARIGDRSLQVGSKRFMAAHDIDISGSITEHELESHGRGRSLVYVARDRSLVGALELEPTLRPEAGQVLGALRKRGASLYLLSGDHEAPTRALAEALGFDRYFAGVLPGDKAQMIEELQAQGRTVCFVGDGINDAIALKKAAVSISIGGASAVAIDSAQITLLDDGLALVPAVFEIADDFQRNLRNIMITLGVPSVLGIGGVFFAGLGPSAMTALYGAAMTWGMAVAMWPHRGRFGFGPRLHARLAASEQVVA